MERIRRPEHENNVEGANVPSAQQIDPSLLERQFATKPEEIPMQPEGEDALEHPTTVDSESTATETHRKPSRAKRAVGAAAAFLALTVGVGVTVAIKNSSEPSGNEVVATSSPLPTTTAAEAVIPPPKHEITTVPATIAPEIPKSERVYTVDGEVTSLKRIKNEQFTVTTAEASTPQEVARNHLGPMLSAVANFGVDPLNQGLRNLYTSPKTGERGLAVYNRDQLLDTDLLDNTGLKNSPVNQLNLLNILVAQNKENVSNRNYTEALLSDITVDEDAPAMNGKKTSVVEATLVLKWLNQGSDTIVGESRPYHLQCYLTRDTANPDMWIFVKGSFTLT